ncbi:ArsR/SmtB family transcription factor [Natrarchaeobius sp. A-rgal3]|uniref:ArsR/SmtB family transcription factor n=1 Tax=Natrarchaeobius versutus TaxID=1679078 RepID=UPI00350EF2D0
MSDSLSLDEETYETLDRLCCGETEAHVESLRGLQPDDGAAETQQAVFKALANEDRLRLLAALRECECCVCELQVVLDAPQSTVATHLRKLKDAGLIKSRKKGKWSYYRIADTAALEILDLAASMETG